MTLFFVLVFYTFKQGRTQEGLLAYSPHIQIEI
jgi:hypothetical protein